MPRWSPVIRTEKSPARIACKACSRSCSGSSFPLGSVGVGLRLAARDDAPGERSLMGVSSTPVRANLVAETRLHKHRTGGPFADQAGTTVKVVKSMTWNSARVLNAWGTQKFPRPEIIWSPKQKRPGEPGRLRLIEEFRSVRRQEPLGLISV